MARPPVDVVVPFRGSAAALHELRQRLAQLDLGPRDSMVVVDNTPGRAPCEERAAGPVPLVAAPALATPGHARNRGAAGGSGEWLVFLDADVVAPPDLIERYFDPAPRDGTAILAGGVEDELVPPGGDAVRRYLYISRGMSQDHTFRHGERWGFPQTANAACRRTAFEAVGGFRDGIRAGEDADLTYRLRAGGWEVERRDAAAAVHRSRQTALRLLEQRAIHGAAAGWLNREYPGIMPARRRPGLVWWALRHCARRAVAAARARDRDEALWAFFEPLEQLALEFGRSLPNERPLPRYSPWRLLLR